MSSRQKTVEPQDYTNEWDLKNKSSNPVILQIHKFILMAETCWCYLSLKLYKYSLVDSENKLSCLGKQK